MSAGTLLSLYVVVLLGALAAVAVYIGLRQRSFGPTRSSDRVFRCEKCAYVYTDDADVDRSRCPQCGLVNDAVKF
jgi:rubrerythrin